MVRSKFRNKTGWQILETGAAPHISFNTLPQVPAFTHAQLTASSVTSFIFHNC